MKAPKTMSTGQPGAFGVWQNAARFHVEHWRGLAPILPLLLFPVIGDLLHSILIRQWRHGNRLAIAKAIRESLRGVLPLLATKLAFELSAGMWALIPVYGYVKAIEHRLYWGMASNVMAFEGLSGTTARRRCRELVDDYSHGIGVRALVIIPSLLLLALMVSWVIAGSAYEPLYVPGFWIFVAALYWVSIPWAGAANTFLYLQMIEREKTQDEELKKS